MIRDHKPRDYDALLNQIPTATASGAVVSIDDGAGDVPIKALGVDNAATTLAVGGANLFYAASIGETAKSGIVYSYEDGVVTAVGTATARADFEIMLADPLIVRDDLKIIATPSVSGISVYMFPIYISGSEKEYGEQVNISGGATITMTSGKRFAGVLLRRFASDTPIDMTINIQLTKTAAAFAAPVTVKTYALTNGTPDEEVTTLKGVNTIWADAGDVSVTYRQDVETLLDKLDARVTALEGA